MLQKPIILRKAISKQLITPTHESNFSEVADFYSSFFYVKKEINSVLPDVYSYVKDADVEVHSEPARTVEPEHNVVIKGVHLMLDLR